MPGNPFTDHPREVGESYFGHMRNAVGVGLTMAGGAIACFVHALFPFLFVRTGSRTIERLHERVQSRTRPESGE